MPELQVAAPPLVARPGVAPWVRGVAATALLVGLADFVQSYLVFSVARHRPLLGVFQGPATGVLGRAAMQGGARTALLGTALHFGIALAWTIAFALAYHSLPRLQRITRSWSGFLALATITGIVVWLVMDWVVLRFSKAHYYPLSEGYFWLLLLGHVPFVGIPLVWGIARLCPNDRGGPPPAT